MWTMPSRKVSSLDKQKRIWKLTFFWCCQFPISQGENLDSVDGSYDDTHDTGMYNSLTSTIWSLISYAIIKSLAKKLFIPTKTISWTPFSALVYNSYEWWKGGGAWHFRNFHNLIHGVVLALIKLNSLRPGSSILVKCHHPPIIKGGLNLINSLGIPPGRACAD